MDKPYWQHYSHPADMGIRGFGRTKQEAFEQAALALTAIITDLKTIEAKQQIEIVCEAQIEDELLLVEWLNALLYEMATRQMLFGRFEVSFEPPGLRARAWGEKINLKRHRPVIEVKAATYCDLKVKCDENQGWSAQCIVDV